MTKSLPIEPLMTSAQAAAYLGVHSRTLKRYCRDGVVKPSVVLPSGQLRFSRESLKALRPANSDDQAAAS